jgi:hypothetical protein
VPVEVAGRAIGPRPRTHIQITNVQWLAGAIALLSLRGSRPRLESMSAINNACFRQLSPSIMSEAVILTKRGAVESRSEGGNGEIVKAARMKPCTCNGANENCCRCSGSGYVLDSGSPPIDPKLQEWIPESRPEKEPSPYVASPERITGRIG